MRRTEKNGTVNSVHRTYKLCCYSTTVNCGQYVFACYESTLAVHSENTLIVSTLTTGNSGQLKMSAKFLPSQKQRFWIWPFWGFSVSKIWIWLQVKVIVDQGKLYINVFKLHYKINANHIIMFTDIKEVDGKNLISHHSRRNKIAGVR